jgi:cell wall assembly regulator SMI1
MAEHLWARLQRVLESAAPGVPRGGLNPPATEAQVAAVERLVGRRLPEDLRAAYRHFNGMTRPGGEANGGPRLMLPFYDWCDLESLARRWTMDRQVPMPPLGDVGDADEMADGGDVDDVDGSASGARCRFAYEDAGWLPVGLCNMSPQVCVDMNPGPAGRPGQLIELDLEAGGPFWMAASFADHVERLLTMLEGGAIRWRDGQYVDESGEWVRRLPGAQERT